MSPTPTQTASLTMRSDGIACLPMCFREQKEATIANRVLASQYPVCNGLAELYLRIQHRADWLEGQVNWEIAKPLR